MTCNSTNTINVTQTRRLIDWSGWSDSVWWIQMENEMNEWLKTYNKVDWNGDIRKLKWAVEDAGKDYYEWKGQKKRIVRTFWEKTFWERRLWDL